MFCTTRFTLIQASPVAQTSADLQFTFHRLTPEHPLCSRMIYLQFNHIIPLLKSSLNKVTACSLPASQANFKLWQVARPKQTLCPECFSPLSLVGSFLVFQDSDQVSPAIVSLLQWLKCFSLYLTPPTAAVTLHFRDSFFVFGFWLE